MAVKKKKEEEVDMTTVEVEAEVETQAAELVKTPDTETGKFCVYLGPSIRGVIQSGTIYDGSLEKTKVFLSPAIAKHPLIGHLLSTDQTIAEDRVKVKTAGNLLHVNYMKLSGKFK